MDSRFIFTFCFDTLLFHLYKCNIYLTLYQFDQALESPEMASRSKKLTFAGNQRFQTMFSMNFFLP